MSDKLTKGVPTFADDEPSLASILEEEPDYGEFRRHPSSMRLREQICYALGLYPNHKERTRWSSSDAEEYERVLHLAQSAIACGGLNCTTVEGAVFVDKTVFFEWATRAGNVLADGYCDCFSPGSLDGLPARNEDLQRDADRLANERLAAGERTISKRSVAQALARTDRWCEMPASTIERITRKNW